MKADILFSKKRVAVYQVLRIDTTMAARLAAAVRGPRRWGVGLGRGVVMGGEVDSFGCVIFVFLARLIQSLEGSEGDSAGALGRVL